MPDFTISHIGSTKLSQPMPFKHIKAKGKTFMFQADDGSNLGTKNEGIPITFEDDFWICAYQTTQELWAAVVNTNDKELEIYPSTFKAKTRPVETVDWEDIQIFNEILNTLFTDKLIVTNNNLNGTFCLPSETQWEYAANAEQDLVFAGSQNLHDVGWFKENSNNQTMPVGLKEPNAFGLYDMCGNVWEWCADNAGPIELIPKNGLLNIHFNEVVKTMRGVGFYDLENCRIRSRHQSQKNNRYYGGGFRLSFLLNLTKNKL